MDQYCRLVVLAFLLPVGTAAAACPPGQALFQEYAPLNVPPKASDPYTAEIVEYDDTNADGNITSRVATTAGAPPRRPATADVQLETTGTRYSIAHADAGWEASIAGPDGTITINVHLIGEATADGQATATATSTLYGDSNGIRGNVMVENIARATPYLPEAGYDVVVQRTVTVTDGCAKLYFQAYANVESTGDAGGQAVADPELSLDPAIADQYTITYSANFFDPDAVPTDTAEPGGDTDLPTTDTDPPPADATDDDEGCGCAAGAPARAGFVPVLGGLVLLRRRRTSQAITPSGTG